MPLFIFSPETIARMQEEGLSPPQTTIKLHILMWVIGPCAMLMGLSSALVPDLNALGAGLAREVVSLLAIPGLDAPGRLLAGRSYVEALALSALIFGLAFRHYAQPGRWYYWFKDAAFIAVPLWAVIFGLHSMGVPSFF
jgi:hypothetical protein